MTRAALINADGALTHVGDLAGLDTAGSTIRNDVPAGYPDSWRWSEDDQDWEPDLSKARLEARKRVQAGRAALIFNPGPEAVCTVTLGVVQCDSASRGLIVGASLIATIAVLNSATFADSWTMANNSSEPVNGASMLEMGLEVGAWVSLVFARGRVLMARIDAAAATLPEIEAITWTLED